MSSASQQTMPLRAKQVFAERRLGFSSFFDFLRQELAPYPGRASTVARMVLAATVTMLILNTFHLPAGALGGYFALIISRESLRNTIQNTWLTIAVFALSTVYVLVGIALFVDSPVTHLLWVIGSFYLIFFVMGTPKNYGLAAGFSFMIATAIPIWDRAGETDAKVALTLYTLLAVTIGALSTLFVELVYRSFHPQDPVMVGIADRLRAAAGMLHAAAEGHAPERPVESLLLQYAMVGPSSLRQRLNRAGMSAAVLARASAAISASARLVEVCATGITDLRRSPEPTAADRERLRALAGTAAQQAHIVSLLPGPEAIGGGQVPTLRASDAPSSYLPVLPEMERDVQLLSDILNSFGVAGQEQQEEGSRARDARARAEPARTLVAAAASLFFVPDAFTTRSHLVFALRGCLAASLCYLIYNGIDWPGINTSVATCIITALATIGSSRQKQLLRVAGAFVGGFCISLPAQVFLLPYMDSITSFTVFFAAVSALGAWFATSSARLSYFGLQIMLAFYLVNLQEPFEQISLAVGRDRVVGVLLGLEIMGLVFDRIAAPRAGARMSTLLRQSLEMLGDLACAVTEVDRDRGGKPLENKALNRFEQLRQSLNDTFSQLNAQADAVQFEYGADRRRQLRERERMQGPMRSLFLLQIALWESQQLPGRSAAGSAGDASRAFLVSCRDALRTIAAFKATPPRRTREEAREPAEMAAARRALQALRSAIGAENPTLLHLCASTLSSLGALDHAARASVDFVQR